MAFGFGWLGVYDAYGPPDSLREEAAAPTIDAVVERIIGVESHGDPNAKNKRSSATGLGNAISLTSLPDFRRASVEVLVVNSSASTSLNVAKNVSSANFIKSSAVLNPLIKN